MKSTGKLTIFVITFLALATTAHAQSPREQLNQMVQQLQKNPGDNALREKIIKLGAKIRPAISAEAERRMVRGSVAFKGATSAAGYQDAAKEFEQATLAAPWYGDAYFNLGVAQDKAGNHEAALRSLKLAQMASPGSKEITNLIYEVEYRNEKARAPEAEAARQTALQKSKDEALLNSLNGTVFVCRYTSHLENVMDAEIHINGREATLLTRNIALTEATKRKGGYVGYVHEGTYKAALTGRIIVDGAVKLEIAPDGQTIRGNSCPNGSSVYQRR